MATQTNHIQETITLNDSQAVNALQRLSSRVSGIGRAFAGVRSVVGGAAGLAGLYGVAQSIGNVNALYESVGRLRAITGLAAADIHGMSDAMDLTGSGEAAERVITRLAAVGQRASGASKEAVRLRQSMSRIGVDMKGGVDQAFLSMASAVQRGKLGINDMARTFKIPLAQAGQVMKTLEQGPERLKRIMGETKNSADVVDDAALASFEKMQQGKRELKDAWEGLVGTLQKKLTPGVTKLIKELTTGLNNAMPIVEKIGTFLADHMDLVVKSAKLYLAYLIAAKAVETASGGKQSLGGMAKDFLGGGEKGGPLKDLMNKLFSKASPGGVAAKAAGAVGAAKPIEAVITAKGLPGMGQAFAQIGKMLATRRAVGTILPGSASGATTALATVGPLAARLSSLLPVLRLVMSVVGRMGVVGLAIATVVGLIMAMYRILSKDIGGHSTRLRKLFSELMSHVGGIYKTLKPAIDMIKSLFGDYLMVAAHAILYYVEYSLTVINKTIQLVKALGYFIGAIFTSPIKTARNISQTWADAWFKAGPDSDLGKIWKKDEKKGKDGKDTPVVPPPPNQDFRGSKFTINQNFAEGFDPGRVAVAITDDLATTADRRRQSGFSPLYSIRSS